MKIPYLFAVLALTAGCLPYNGYYKSGVAAGRLDADLTDCQVDAVNRVPPNTQIRTTPVTVIPGRKVCSEGEVSAKRPTCSYVPAQIHGGDTYTYDANEDLRKRVTGQCMTRRGYSRVKLPACTGAAARTAKATRQQVLPRLDASLCAAKGANGGWVFVPQS